MKTKLGRITVLLLLLLPLVQSSRGQAMKEDKKSEPIRSEERIKGRGYAAYNENEIIVIFKNEPTAAQRNRIKQAIRAGRRLQIVDTQCSTCDSYIELWKGKGLHTVIHSDGVSGGSAGSTKGVGEDSLARYSLNYISRSPVEYAPPLLDSISFFKPSSIINAINGANKDTIIVAVLDTGIDTVSYVNPRFLWTNRLEESNGPGAEENCYKDGKHGWNFIDGNADILDDNSSLHGTLVSSYIIDECSGAAKNFIQIMPLKTHDKNGSGDLFRSICAIHYAMRNKANIINASWGFYYYGKTVHPYLDSLITKVLREQGILFITAAGNRLPDDDLYAAGIYRGATGRNISQEELRNLELHNFYPACLSGIDNNVITVTTTDETAVSPTQNYSSRYVDLGVKADRVTPLRMEFLEPFTYPSPAAYTSGSSFAAAIAAGKIGAFLPNAIYKRDISKDTVMRWLLEVPGLASENTVLRSRMLIRKGTIINRK